MIFSKNIFKKILNAFKIDSIAILFTKNSYLRKVGWLKSFKLGKPVDENAIPIPWMTYSFIDFIKSRLNKSIHIFEFGGGNSTIWFAQFVNTITSVENDQKWVEYIGKSMPPNAKLLYRDTNNIKYSDLSFAKIGNPSLYSKTIQENNFKYDLIIIDGVDRNNCIVNSLSNISEDGVFVIDNYEFKNEMKEALEKLFENGFKVLEFWGMSPMIYNKSCSTIFYRENNCLGI